MSKSGVVKISMFFMGLLFVDNFEEIIRYIKFLIFCVLFFYFIFMYEIVWIWKSILILYNYVCMDLVGIFSYVFLFKFLY